MSKRFSWSFVIILLTLTCFILFFILNSKYLAAKPIVDTVEANVLESSVTLNGVLKDGQKISQYGFKWGTSRSLSGSANLGSKIKDNTEFSTKLSGLKAGHTYYYRAYALNSKGYGLGDIKRFTVPMGKNAAPTIMISNPADHLMVNIGAVVTVSAAAKDDKKVEAMGLYINDAAQSRTNRDALTFDWNTSGIKAGEYQLKVTAWDGSQAAETVQIVTVQEGKKVDIVQNEQTIVKENNNNTNSNTTNTNNNNNNSISVSRDGDSTDTHKYSKLSKVNGIFGQFHYRELSGGRIEVDPLWVAENIVTITLPGLNRKVQVHKAAADHFIMAFNYIKNGTATVNGKQVSLLSLIETMDGTYVTRHVNWNPGNGLSNHSWATAIDINADGHFGYVDSATDPNMILWEKAFQPAGFSWGNRYSDSMHYELIK